MPFALRAHGWRRCCGVALSSLRAHARTRCREMADCAGANPFGQPAAPSDSPQNPFATADDSSTTSLSPALGRPPDEAPSGLALGRASLALDYASDAGAWIPPNPFKFCVVFQIHALRGLPADVQLADEALALGVGGQPAQRVDLEHDAELERVGRDPRARVRRLVQCQ